jgi:DNA-binding MarR family transcriptional regulator
MYKKKILQFYKEGLLTRLEYRVLNHIVKADDLFVWYDNTDCSNFKSLYKELNLKEESLKGILGSLIKKGYLQKDISSDINWITTTPLVYGISLNEEFKEIFKSYN